MDIDINGILNKYKKWLDKTKDTHPEVQRSNAKWVQDNILDVNKLRSLNDDEYVKVFKKLLKIPDGPVGINFGRDRILNTRSDFTNALDYLTNSSDEMLIKVHKIREGELSIPYYGLAIWSVIFNAQYPNKFPKFNQKTERFFNSIGIDTRKLSKTEKYKLVTNKFQEWQNNSADIDMFELDHLMHYGTEVPEGLGYISGIINGPKLEELVNKYIDYVNQVGIDNHIKNEGYKFQDINQFQANFNLDAENLSEMLEKSIASDNLSGTGNYFPRAMLIDYANFDQESTREALRVLMDDNNELQARVEGYTRLINDIHKRRDTSLGQDNSTYQDARFISLLLSFKNPKEIGYYKNKELKAALAYVDGKKTSIGGDNVAKIQASTNFCKQIVDTLQKNSKAEPIIDAFRKIYSEIDDNLWLAQDVYLNFSRWSDVSKDNFDLYSLILSFVKDADAGSLKNKKYSQLYKDCVIDASFGMGTPANIPWIGFHHKSSPYNEDMFVNLLYYKDINKLLLVYGVPENHEPKKKWKLDNVTVKDYFAPDYDPFRYGSSFFINEYDAASIPETVVDDINNALEEYRNQDLGESGTNYWIFQGNPDVFDIEGYLFSNEGKRIDWSANQYTDQMQKGDLVYFWASKGGGLAGLGIIASEAQERKEDDDERDLGVNKIDVELLRYFNPDKRLKREDLVNNTTLSKSSIIKQPQGSNFTLSTDEAFELQKLIATHGLVNIWLFTPGTNNEFLDDTKDNNRIRLGWDKVGDLSSYSDNDYEKIKQLLVENYNDIGENPYNTSSALGDFSYVMKKGDVVILKKGYENLKSIGHITGDYNFNGSLKEFKHERKAVFSKYGDWKYNPNMPPAMDNAAESLPVKTMTQIGSYPDFVQRIINSMSNKSDNIEETGGEIMPNTISLNTILYGPPGTGKTFNTRKIAEELLADQSTIKPREEQIVSAVSDLTWKQITALAMYMNGQNKPMHISDLRNNEYVKAYASTKTSKNYAATISTQILIAAKKSDTTLSDLYKGKEELFEKSTDGNGWLLTDEGKELVAGGLTDIIETLDNLQTEQKSFKDFYKFITFHQSYSYEEFVEGIRPVINPDEADGQIKYEIKPGIFKELCSQAAKDPNNNYLLIIDEVNRGNISKIFGELITLIEPNKRLGAAEELTVTLPYSQESFGVPKNLYILGTMNTADRSIALLDVALRRRFTFKEMMPDYSLVTDNLDGVNLKKLLRVINEKLILMVDRDHQIGHSFFMDSKVNNLDDLRTVWYQEIIPLLQEYFYNDWDRLKEIVLAKNDNGGFLEKKGYGKNFNKESEYTELDSYEVHYYTQLDVFKQAIISVYEDQAKAN